MTFLEDNTDPILENIRNKFAVTLADLVTEYAQEIEPFLHPDEGDTEMRREVADVVSEAVPEGLRFYRYKRDRK